MRSWVWGLLLVSSTSFGALQVPQELGEPLSAVLRSGRTGLGSPDDLRGPYPMSRLQEQVREYLHLRRDRVAAEVKAVAVAQCLAAPVENIFCDLILDSRGARAAGGTLGARVTAGANAELEVALRTADWDKLRRATESQLHRALRGIDRWDSLKKVVDRVTGALDCPPVALATALGQKAEEFFPAEALRKDAQKLYGRAAACAGPEEEAAVAKARFRLALLRIWEGDCPGADPLLGTLTRAREGEFTLRSLFWRAHCARERGDKLGFAAQKNRLRREFPLSFHGIALLDRKERLGIPLLTGWEPPVRLRSTARPALNGILAAAELLQKQGALDVSAELLDVHQEKFEEAESAVRLYVAVLYFRAHQNFGLFRTLSSVFRDDGDAVARSTLEIFYPLQGFNLIRTKASSHVDPLLVTALIRQESGFNAQARSPAGALGLMQLMPQTARRYGRVARRRLLDAGTNVQVGARYFRALLDRFSGDAELALAAYNAGPEKVDDWRKRYPVQNRLLFLDFIPFQETRNYVALIGRNYFWYSLLYGQEQPVSSRKKPIRLASAQSARFPSLQVERAP